MAPQFEYAIDRQLDQIADLMAASFEGYIVSIPFSVSLLLSIMRTEGVDLSASRIIQEAGKDVGTAIVCRRGAECRVGLFGIITEARGRGLGQALVDQLILDAKARGERRMVLECIEQNPAAIKLYEGKGFTKRRRLLGFSATTVPAAPNSDLMEVPISEVAMAIGRGVENDLPWQISPASLMQGAKPNVGYQLGPSYAIVIPTAAGIQLRAMVTEPSERRKGHGRRLIQAIAANHPGQVWSIAPLWPEENVANFLAPLGFTPTAISQWQMELRLD